MYFSWKRPDDVAFPSVWLDFKAKDLDSTEKVNYRIQDLPESRIGDAIKLLCDHYIRDETLFAAKEMSKDEVSINEAIDFWRLALSQRMTLACFKQGSNELIGLNILCVYNKSEYYDKYDCTGKAYQEFFNLINFIRSEVNVCEIHKVDKYMAAFGLSVLPEYQGRGIATELLRARLPLARACDIKLTSTLFTSLSSQITAYKVGFKTDYEVTFEELHNLGFKFPNTSHKSIKQMSLLID